MMIGSRTLVSGMRTSLTSPSEGTDGTGTIDVAASFLTNARWYGTCDFGVTVMRNGPLVSGILMPASDHTEVGTGGIKPISLSYMPGWLASPCSNWPPSEDLSANPLPLILGAHVTCLRSPLCSGCAPTTTGALAIGSLEYRL